MSWLNNLKVVIDPAVIDPVVGEDLMVEVDVAAEVSEAVVRVAE